MQVIAYLVYGNGPEYHLELSYSVLSALRHLKRSPSPIRIALITDESNARPDLPVEHVLFSADEFNEWTSGGEYLHQAQHRALGKALDHFRGKVALVDTDTYFIDHPAKLFRNIAPGRALMHADEGPVGEQPVWTPIFDVIGEEAEIAGYPVSSRQTMYNAGVIGLDFHDRALVDDATALVRTLYAIAPVFNVEQFVVGTVLATRTWLSLCPGVVKHYWGFERRFIHAQSARFFHEPGLTHFERLLRAEDLPKVGYPAKSMTDRIAARVLGAWRRAGSLYRFAYLAYRSALTAAARDPVYANVWARVALDALRMHRERRVEPSARPLARDFIERDFDAFGERAIDGLWWASDETKRSWGEFWGEALEAG